MSKMLKDTELLDIIRRVIEGNELDADDYEDFLRRTAEVVTEFFGGDVGSISTDPYDGLGHVVAIRWNDSVPANSGIYAEYDPDADFDSEDDEPS